MSGEKTTGMLFQFLAKHPALHSYLDKYLPLQERLEVPAKTCLLEEGKRSQHYIYIEKGCLRAYFSKNGEDKTAQFFFEEDGLASFDSFINNVPSPFTIETIEPCILQLLDREHFIRLLSDLDNEPHFLLNILQLMSKRQLHYMSEFVSVLKDSPEERYQHLLKEKPHFIRRIPQHYIASYLGVSTVHLSRIKRKLAKGDAHF
jgi:CRP-like cAMP-binding protein